MKVHQDITDISGFDQFWQDQNPNKDFSIREKNLNPTRALLNLQKMTQLTKNQEKYGIDMISNYLKKVSEEK